MGCPVRSRWDDFKVKPKDKNYYDCPITIQPDKCRCGVHTKDEGVQCKKKWFVCPFCYPEYCTLDLIENEKAIIGKISWIVN